jgi:hypothetical protein
MDIELEKKCIAEAVFAVTGQRLPEDDALVVAALFYANTVRRAGDVAVQLITDAGSQMTEDIKKTLDEAIAVLQASVDQVQADVRKASKAAESASQVALAVSRQAAIQQGAFVEILDAGMNKHTQKVLRGQREPVVKEIVPRLRMLAAGLGGALAFGLANFAACGYSLSWVHDASTGREFLRAAPYLSPDLRAALIAELEKFQHNK